MGEQVIYNLMFAQEVDLIFLSDLSCSCYILKGLTKYFIKIIKII